MSNDDHRAGGHAVKPEVHANDDSTVNEPAFSRSWGERHPRRQCASDVDRSRSGGAPARRAPVTLDDTTGAALVPA